MLKKTITYTDYNGVERNEDFWFNLTNAELMELELSTSGGLTETIKKIVSTQDTPAIMKLFKDLILRSYGEKSADGKHFIKIDDDGKMLNNKFSQTEAYSILFTELAQDDKAASEFVNGIVPAETAKKAALNK